MTQQVPLTRDNDFDYLMFDQETDSRLTKVLHEIAKQHGVEQGERVTFLETELRAAMAEVLDGIGSDADGEDVD